MTKGNNWLADLWDPSAARTKTPKAPPNMQATKIAGMLKINWPKEMSIGKNKAMNNPNKITPIAWTNETKVSPKILPMIMEYLEIGETNISWEKSLSLSWIKEMIPEAVEANKV